MKKKVGIMTFHKAANFGAVLQAYALQNAINSQFNQFDAIIVDYECKKIENSYKVFNRNCENLLIEFLRFPICLPKRMSKRKRFDNFIKKYLKLTQKRYSYKTIKESDSEFDYFLVGSDQVWNYNLTGCDWTYLLDFVEDSKKKLSYAASFGIKSIPENLKKQYQDYLGKFDLLSIRETTSGNILKKLKCNDYVVSCDPTFLLSKKEWLSLCKKVDESKKYILLYELKPSINLIKFCGRLAYEKQCEIYVLSDSYSKFKGLKHIRDASPNDFLSWIANAEYVVTNSFHGTAFSLIFQKNFFVETNTKSGKNERIESLINDCNLNYRDISYKSFDKYKNINWDCSTKMIKRKTEEFYNIMAQYLK